MGGEELIQEGSSVSNVLEERIRVSVRLRPLNEKELAKNDLSDWECMNNKSIVFRSSLPERAMSPSAYTFDNVFGCDSTTKQVYEEGAKEVALSVVNGINSTIFAYGQTSSGKTYTMNGVTQYSVDDIYDHIEKHQDREFVLKFSAIEIYNEAVRDLLSSDNVPLRLLDDPEKGTVVEKLTEETLKDRSHLLELLSFCEAQRKVGETSLNETSSRSHQILRLSIESAASRYMKSGMSNRLAATVNFVDLAGSERASQTMSAGARLKEGCHINRSLLSLGTVIRKLSKGKNGHIPYRDSKLTRILQNSLGGNARTAIICTLSPAHSHVEQSKNTLLFAICAKEVSTNAQVNVVMSDKALVKQLQRELARLESEMKGLSSFSAKGDSDALLKEKELMIEKMDKEIRELTQQRDQAQYRIENLLHSIKEDQLSKLDEMSVHSSVPDIGDLVDLHSTHDSGPRTVDSFMNVGAHIENRPDKVDHLFSMSHEDNFLLDGTTPEFTGPDPYNDWEEIAQIACTSPEDSCKDVQCIELEESKRWNEESNLSVASFEENEEKEEKEKVPSIIGIDQVTSPKKENKEFFTVNTDDDPNDRLIQKTAEIQKQLNCIVNFYPSEQSLSSIIEAKTRFENVKLTRSKSSLTVLMAIPPSTWIEKAEQDKKKRSAESEINFSGKVEGGQRRRGLSSGNLEIPDSHSQLSVSSRSREPKFMEAIDEDDDNTSVLNFATGRSKHRSKKKHTTTSNLGSRPRPDWFMAFQRQQTDIIELWDICNVPLVHRSHFFILFKGDPSDAVYMEVELRRLYFMKEAFTQQTYIRGKSDTQSQASSLKALNREREMLSKRVKKKYSMKERISLYEKWDIELKTKQRSLQLTRKIWSNRSDLNHIKESAILVAKLIGFPEPSQVPREMFGLTFSHKSSDTRSFLSKIL